jgi:xylose dehydrogenase (NAD/NADP)
MPAPTNPAPLRWGILGAARIAAKSLIPALRASGGEVSALAASDRRRAESFAREHGIPRVHDGYSALLDDPEIDAIYLPLANDAHQTWAIRAAGAGKHCLCEKPMALNAREAAEMVDAFQKSGTVLQEAFMWRHHEQVAWLSERIAQGELGELVAMHGHFSFALDRPGDYRWQAARGGGSFWDVGCYCVNAARLFFGGEPVAVSGRFCLHRRNGGDGDPVDESAAGWLDFGRGRLATFSSSFVASFAQGVELVGTKARAWISRPWLQAGGTPRILIETDGARAVREFPAVNGYVRMIRQFTARARNPSEGLSPGEDGLDQARAMDAIFQSAKADGSPATLSS